MGCLGDNIHRNPIPITKRTLIDSNSNPGLQDFIFCCTFTLIFSDNVFKYHNCFVTSCLWKRKQILQNFTKFTKTNSKWDFEKETNVEFRGTFVNVFCDPEFCYCDHACQHTAYHVGMKMLSFKGQMGVKHRKWNIVFHTHTHTYTDTVIAPALY